jgi:hypothetical protein
MDNKNIIFQMPFDESDGALVAYDYSSNRADGVVSGAHFVQGKNGNAISFSGDDTCEVDKSILPTLSVDFSMLMWVNGAECEVGTPTQLIWMLSFAGLDNYVEVPIEAKSGTWFSLALVKHGVKYRFYVNSSLIKEVTNGGTLQGVSLNQDHYGGDYGFGLLDDVKMYNLALSQQDLISEISSAKQQTYTIDGHDFKDYGIYVSASDGLLSRPKLKDPLTVNWDNYHGESVDLMHKFIEARDITLSCFVKAESKIDFIKRVNDFAHLFDKKGTNRLVVDVHPVKPLIYEVYIKDEIEVSKTWNDSLMVGTFKLKLREPEPVKKVLKHIRVSEATKTCKITLTSTKYVNIYWGDGKVDYDIAGKDVSVQHEYTENGDYFPVVTGCIDEITSFTTNAIIVWERI